MLKTDSQEINPTITEINKADIQRRSKEIDDSGLKKNNKGVFMGMQVLEGPVVIRDSSSGRDKRVELQTRIILSRQIDLPTLIDTQFSEYSKKNNSLFATLLFKGLALFNYNRIAISHPNNVGGKMGTANDALISLINLYKKINKRKKGHPLTVIYAHGDVDLMGKHFTFSGEGEDYSTDLVLENLAKQYPIPTDIEKIPVLYVSCNERYGGSSTLSHPKMRIAYKEGTVGLFHESGEVKLSG